MDVKYPQVQTFSDLSVPGNCCVTIHLGPFEWFSTARNHTLVVCTHIRGGKRVGYLLMTRDDALETVLRVYREGQIPLGLHWRLVRGLAVHKAMDQRCGHSA